VEHRRISRVGSIATRLVALIVLPIATIGYLGVQTIDRETDNAVAAREVARDADFQRAIASVISPAQLELLALEGLARIDTLGVPREAVAQISGINLEETYSQNATELDAVLDDLINDYGNRSLADGHPLSEHITEIRESLEIQRSRSAQRTATRADVRAVFDFLDATLNEALNTNAESGAGSITISAATERDQLAALRSVQINAGVSGRALLDDLTAGDSGVGIVAASEQLDKSIATFELYVRPDQVADFDRVLVNRQPIPDALLMAATVDGPLAEFDSVDVELAATTFLQHITFLDVLERYSTKLHTEAAVNLQAQASSAEAVVARTQLIVISLVAVTLVLTMLIAGSTLRPLRRLRRRATQVADGQLDLSPLPVRGPSDVRMLTVAVNGMLATLQAVDQQVRSLADGKSVESPTRVLPGDIGVSLRQSLEHLELVTTQLHTSEELASAIVEQAVDGIWTIDEAGRITSANDASETILGISAAEQVGQLISSFFATLDGDVVIERAGESPVRCLVANSLIDGGAESLTAVIARDVSEHLRYEERLAYQAHHDALTGLPNRYALLDHIDRLGDERVAILFLDLDGFKTVNDVQGHAAGDAVLEEIAQRLLASIRPSDLVGRIGGDEFVVTMRDFASVDDVVSFGQRLIREVELPYQDGAQAFAISASIGVAVYDHGLKPEGLDALGAIQQADSAVYLAKRRGRGRVEIFDNELQSEMLRDADLELALRTAAFTGQLELHLQPIMNLETGEFTSAEALVRWNRPGVGLVPPGDFIPVAERSGVIFEIEQWVLNESCATLARWHEADPTREIKIAVNISGRHLLEGDLLADLQNAIESTGADPRLLEIELTETQLLDDLERAASILDAIRALGITVAIDDFGTGYSSMAYLQQLPIDTLKIDRQFISVISDTGFDPSMLDALLTIASALGVSVVAEGIENAAQLEHLSERDCHRGQGFLLARPVPIDQAEAVMGIRPAGCQTPAGTGASFAQV
jgi:diguanylate cyclase (GGDEF)-like protein